MTLRQLKKVLLSLIAIGSLGSLTVASTFALSSESHNARSSLATGTLTLNDTVTGGSTCYSYNGSENVNHACQAVMASSSLHYPGEAAVVSLKIANDGSLDSGELLVYMPSCKAQNTPSAPSPGSGDPCAEGGDQIYVQETDSSGTATQCWYPLHVSGECSWARNSLRIFALKHAEAATAVDLGAGPAHGGTRYFKIGLRIPSEAGNELQGRQAVFGLAWRLRT